MGGPARRGPVLGTTDERDSADPGLAEGAPGRGAGAAGDTSERRGRIRRAIAAALAVAAVLVLADLGTAAAAESGISREMRDRLGLPEDPPVQIDGFSFLAQAVTGRYGHVEVAMKRVPIGALRTPEVQVQLYGVRASLSDLIGPGRAEFRAAAAEGIVQVSPMDVRRMVVAAGGPAAAVTRLTVEQLDADAIDTAVRAGADPRLRGLDPRTAARFVAELPVDGANARISIISALVVNDEVMRIVPLDVREYGTNEPVPAAVRASLTKALGVELNPGRLPLGVTPTSATVPDYNTLQISGAVRDVSFRNGDRDSASR